MTFDLRAYNRGVSLARYAYRTDAFALSRLITSREIAWLRLRGRISDEEATRMRAEVRGWGA